MAAVYTLTVFVAAALLFLVQPMAARWALPVFGGTPAVWTTAMLLFQLLLLAGYAYAHWLSSLARLRTQLVVHAVVMLVCGLLLPIGLPPSMESWAAQGEGGVWRVLALLGVCAGAPFFAVSTLGPLLQRWFARTRHARAHDPYFLYAASNAGSVLGLLGYPLLVEPSLGLREQGVWWSAGYVALALLVLGCGLLVQERRTDRSPSRALGGRPAWSSRASWVLLAFIPSTLMLGVTLKLTTDVAAFPLLWVLPLTVYLATFVIAFAQSRGDPSRLPSMLWWLLAPALAIAMLGQALLPVLVSLPLHLIGLLVGGLVCHGRLAATRPAAEHLTEFYLWLAVGGALGGVFNALVAPSVFNDVWEYPIALAMVGIAAASAGPSGMKRWAGPALGGVCCAAVLVVGGRSLVRTMPDLPALAVLGPLVISVIVLASLGRSAWAAALLAAMFVGTPRAFEPIDRTRTRSFFGVHTLSESPDGSLRIYTHGTTPHGMQRLDPAFGATGTAYYGPQSPAAEVFRIADPDRFAVIGLGIGTLAVYGEAGAEADLIEIDPEVVRIAREPSLFTFLRDARCEIRVIIADGRRAIEAAEPASYDLIVLDAFSSDAIPVHLLTVEAMAAYERALADGGLILMHISNRSLDLRPAVSRLAEARGLAVRARDDLPVDPDTGQRPAWLFASQWAVFATSEAAFAELGDRWQQIPLARGSAWTDDHASVLSAIRWR